MTFKITAEEKRQILKRRTTSYGMRILGDNYRQRSLKNIDEGLTRQAYDTSLSYWEEVWEDFSYIEDILSTLNEVEISDLLQRQKPALRLKVDKEFTDIVELGSEFVSRMLTFRKRLDKLLKQRF